LRGRKVNPKTPQGVRIYAIGDVHGRADLLEQLFATIDADISSHSASEVIEVLLGDYIDRGPQSRAVIDILMARSHQRQLVCLKGNHETYISGFLQDPIVLEQWKHLGGIETLLSYGLTPPVNADERQRIELADAFGRVIPETHRRFIARLRPCFICGDYFFVHAGVRPGIPLARQQERDLLWIREEFLLHDQGFCKVIVHGHTPVVEPDIRPSRINIDTGAYATGRLTCLVLEDDDLVFI
jgi:serine/threonine protein phosphatase 1